MAKNISSIALILYCVNEHVILKLQYQELCSIDPTQAGLLAGTSRKHPMNKFLYDCLCFRSIIYYDCKVYSPHLHFALM